MEEERACEYQIGARFSDFEHLVETVRAWDLDFYQMEKGGFQAELLQRGVPGMQVAETIFSRGLEQHGAAPAGMRTFIIPGADSSPFKWRGYEVGRNEMLIFPRSLELYSISQGGFHIFGYSVGEDVLCEAGRVMGCERIEEFLDSGVEVVSLQEPRIAELRRVLRTTLRSERGELPDGLNSWLKKALEWDIVTLLIESIMESIPLRIEREPSPMRASALKQAITLVSDHGNHPVTVETICRETGVKARTLQYAFREEFGLSPKQWLKLRSLNHVRKDLRKADPSEFGVADVANKWGLWHMGQLAKDYRLAFGELPSETLQRH